MEDRSARMASMLSKEATCMMLSFLKLRMMMANRGRISKLSKPRIWKGNIEDIYQDWSYIAGLLTKSQRTKSWSGGKCPEKARISHLKTTLSLWEYIRYMKLAI